MLSKMEGIRKRERLNVRWINSMKEAPDMHQQELSRPDEGGQGQHHFRRVPENWSKLNGTKHTHTNVTY